MADHVTIKEKDFSRGIDARSAETELQPGYVEDALNLDLAQGRMKKRSGYGHFASLPVSVKEVYANAVTNEIELTLPLSVNLSTTPSGPVILYGSVDTNVANWDLTTTTQSLFYNSATPVTTVNLPNPYVAPITVDVDLFTTNEFSAYLTEKAGVNNENFFSQTISINKTTFQISIVYSPPGADIQAYVYYKDRTDSNIQTYTGASSASITGASWSPETTNIGIEVWEDVGGTYQRIIPDVAKITDSATGDVLVQLTDTTDFRVVLTSIPAANAANQTLSGESTLTVNIPNAETPFLIPYFYTANGAELTLCEVSSVVYDADTNSHDVTLINLDTVAFSLEYFWEYGEVVFNKLTVPNSGSPVASYSYENHQLVVYGLVPSEIYKEDGDGYVNHIDGYIKEGTASAITALHGNVFVEYDKNDVTLPSLYPALYGRVASDITIGPAFHSAASSRTSGDVVSSDVDGTYQLPCVAVEWQSGNLVKYTLQATAVSVSGTPVQQGDMLSISQMSHSSLDGDFEIDSISYSTNLIEVVVTNTAIIDSSFDDSNCGGFAGVFTDRVLLSSTSPQPGASLFLPGDSLSASGLSNFATTVTSIETDVLVIDGLTSLLQLAAGVKITGARTSEAIPLRNGLFVASTDYIVPGDVVLTDKLVVSVNSASEEVVGVSGTTLSVIDSSKWVAGSKILLARDGVYTVSSIISATELELTEAPSVTSGATILRDYIILHEAAEIEDCADCLVEVERRLYPATAPTITSTLTTNKASQSLPAMPDSGSLALRSTMVSDNMYFVDGTNPPLKLDGTNIMRPSLPNFNPIYSTRFVADAAGNFGQTSSAAFKTTKGYLEASGTNKITVYYTGNSITKATDVNNFAPGDYIRLSASGEELYAYVDHVEVIDGTASGGGATNKTTSQTIATSVKIGYIYVDRALTPASYSIDEDFTITRAFVYKYYARLNYLDANRNIIASPAKGYFDTIITQAEAGKVVHKFISPPTYDLYDYAKMELQLYRTKADGAVFYNVVTLPLTFNNGEPYVEFTDTRRDDDLLDAVDPTSVPIDGEVGVTFHGLPIAKHITSINNSLVLGDITSESTLEINVEQVNASAAISDFSGKYIQIKEDSTGASGDSETFEFVASGVAVVGTKVAGTSGTVTITDTHGFSVGDWIYVTYNTTLNEDVTPYIGWHQISAVSTTVSYSFKCPVAVEMGDTSNLYVVKASNTTRVPVYTGTDLAYSNSVGNSSTPLIRIMYRLAQAINASQRATDVSISGQENFIPWVIAEHNAIRAGGITLISPRYSTTSLGAVYPSVTNPAYYKWFANGNSWTSGTVASEQIRFPSRIIASYQNYPEMFDAPYVTYSKDSDSAIDVNPADGQEITGVIPFFGDTAFGAALRGGVLVVFKQNSIYLVDLAVKAQGLNPVQRLETNGIGCTYPRSITVSKEAIFFAHRSGVWALRRDMRVEYIGKYIERLVEEASGFEEATAHHSPDKKSYMLSYGLSSATYNDGVLVYNHSNEEGGQLGSWTRYDSIPASGWANLNSEELFSSNKGQLFFVLKTRTSEDFSDVGEAISATLVCRAMDFGDSGIRKQLRHVFTHFRPVTPLTDVELFVAIDMSTTFEATTDFEISKGGSGNSLSLNGSKKAQTVGHNCPTERAEYFQIKIVDSGFKEGMDLIGLDYMVLGLSHHGLPDAYSTRSR
jgi:hypothetical protein